MKTLLRVRQTTIWVLVSFGMSACMSTTPQWDKNFGESLNRIKAAQTLHPTPPQTDEKLDGMDAAAAVRAQNQYLHSFEAPSERKK